MQSIYFIQSYPQLKNLNKYFHINKDNDIKIFVIGNKFLYNFLKDFVNIDNIYFINEVSFSYKNFFDILKARKYVNSLIQKDWPTDIVFFSSYEFVGVLAVILSKYRNNLIKIIHLADPNCDVYTSSTMTLSGFIDFWKYYIDKFVFGNVFEYASFIPKLNRKYIRRLSTDLVNDLNISIEPCSNRLIEYNNTIYSKYIYDKAYESCRILIVLKDMIGQNLVTIDNYVEQWNLIKQALLAHFDTSEIWIKAKPGKKTQIDIDLFEPFEFVPDCIPFEKLKLVDNVIILGFSSTAMANSKYKTISLLDMFDIIKVDNVERSKRVLKSRSVNDIQYPNNIKELLHIIA